MKGKIWSFTKLHQNLETPKTTATGLFSALFLVIMRYFLHFLKCKNVWAFQKWPYILLIFLSLDAMCVFVKILTNYAAPGMVYSRIYTAGYIIQNIYCRKCTAVFIPHIIFISNKITHYRLENREIKS